MGRRTTNDTHPVEPTITAYLDESGTHAGSDAVSVAGYLATPTAWQRFTVEWQTALDDWQLEYFHMSEFAHRVNAYASWAEPVRRERLKRLIGITNSHVLGSVGTVVPMALYDRKFSAAGRARLKTGGPYGLAATCNVMEVAKIVRELRGEPRVAYVLEQGAVGRDQVTRVLRDNLNDAARATRSGSSQSPSRTSDNHCRSRRQTFWLTSCTCTCRVNSGRAPSHRGSTT